MKLENKTAVITGAARGIGRAIAERYAAEGATVVIADRLLEQAQFTAKTIGGRSFATELDVSSHSSIEACVKTVTERAGSIDILVNGAAVFDLAPLLEIKADSFDRLFDVNVKGLLFMTQAISRQMVHQGQGGKIINIASQAGRRGEALAAIYCASKAAVISLTQSCGLALIGHGINVNGIAPGVIDTAMWDEVDALFAKYENRPLGEKKRLVGNEVPYGRMGTPEDVVGAAVFLASSDSDYIVAQTLNVDGGNWMS